MLRFGNIVINGRNNIKETYDLFRISNNKQILYREIDINGIKIREMENKITSVYVPSMEKITIRKLSNGRFRYNSNIVDSIELYNDLTNIGNKSVDIQLITVYGKPLRRVILIDNCYVIVDEEKRELIGYGESDEYIDNHRLYEFLFGYKNTIYDDASLIIQNRPIIRAIVEYYRDENGNNIVKLVGKDISTFKIDLSTFVTPKEITEILSLFKYQIQLEEKITLKELFRIISG